MTCPGARLDADAWVSFCGISGLSTTEAVEREVRDLRVLADHHTLSERGAIRSRARLTSSTMLFVSDVADTTHPSWKELGNLTHKILVETSDVERHRKGGAFR